MDRRKAYRERHPEKVKESNLLYRQKNKEKIAAQKKAWKSANHDKAAQYRKTFSEKHPEKNAEWKRAYYARMMVENPEKLREYWKENYDKDAAIARAKKWKKANPDRMAALTADRRARRIKATPKWANKFFINEAYHLAKLRINATGFKWEVDHIFPLNSDVVCGLHVENNLQVIPAVMNNRKGNRLMGVLP